MNPEIKDNINKPSHYQGANGLEAIDVVHNFVGIFLERLLSFGAMQSSICFASRRRMVLKT